MLKLHKRTPKWIYEFTSKLAELGEPELDAVVLRSPGAIELDTEREGRWSSWYGEPVYIHGDTTNKVTLRYGWHDEEKFDYVSQVKVYMMDKDKYKEMVLFFFDALRGTWFVTRCAQYKSYWVG